MSKDVKSPFLRLLWAMLNTDNEARPMIGWTKDGNIEIKDVEGLEREILPRYFKSNKASSFLRQLNLWGFVKVHPRDSSNLEYQNPSFVKGKPELLQTITRRVNVQAKALDAVAPSAGGSSARPKAPAKTKAAAAGQEPARKRRKKNEEPSEEEEEEEEEEQGMEEEDGGEGQEEEEEPESSGKRSKKAGEKKKQKNSSSAGAAAAGAGAGGGRGKGAYRLLPEQMGLLPVYDEGEEEEEGQQQYQHQEGTSSSISSSAANAAGGAGGAAGRVGLKRTRSGGKVGFRSSASDGGGSGHPHDAADADGDGYGDTKSSNDGASALALCGGKAAGSGGGDDDEEDDGGEGEGEEDENCSAPQDALALVGAGGACASQAAGEAAFALSKDQAKSCRTRARIRGLEKRVAAQEVAINWLLAQLRVYQDSALRHVEASVNRDIDTILLGLYNSFVASGFILSVSTDAATGKKALRFSLSPEIAASAASAGSSSSSASTGSSSSSSSSSSSVPFETFRSLLRGSPWWPAITTASSAISDGSAGAGGSRQQQSLAAPAHVRMMPPIGADGESIVNAAKAWAKKQQQQQQQQQAASASSSSTASGAASASAAASGGGGNGRTQRPRRVESFLNEYLGPVAAAAAPGAKDASATAGAPVVTAALPGSAVAAGSSSLSSSSSALSAGGLNLYSGPPAMLVRFPSFEEGMTKAERDALAAHEAKVAQLLGAKPAAAAFPSAASADPGASSSSSSAAAKGRMGSFHGFSTNNSYNGLIAPPLPPQVAALLPSSSFSSAVASSSGTGGVGVGVGGAGLGSGLAGVPGLARTRGLNSTAMPSPPLMMTMLPTAAAPSFRRSSSSNSIGQLATTMGMGMGPIPSSNQGQGGRSRRGSRGGGGAVSVGAGGGGEDDDKASVSATTGGHGIWPPPAFDLPL